jgi:hypothetical protein
MKAARLSVFVLLPLLLAGCSSFERTTFNSLAASKAVIDQAQADYTAGTIKQTKCSYAVINDAKAAQTVAVDGMVLYETEKAAGASLGAQEQAVAVDLTVIVPAIVQVKALYTTGCTGATQ